MAYQTALTIAEVIKDIHEKKYLLPAIQREFVWDPEQIERLFDSLMRDYPINSFLFWQVSKDKVNDYEFYEFLREYHEKKGRRNPKANVSGADEITAVLDGQQRLTSLYVALKGTYAEKLPRKRWNNPDAYPKKKLYINLLKRSANPDLEFDFRFLIPKAADDQDGEHFWFPVNEILDLNELEHINQFLIENELFTNYDKEKAGFANKVLSKLYKVIHVQPSISFYLEKSQELDKVLNIFIRINSGGTVLSYSDLLLSIATAQWEKLDAREEITQFVDQINDIGDGFNFNKDFVLKSCLVLSDFTDIAFKVDNFNKANMLKIEENWEDISHAIRLAVALVASFGYSRETLVSNNAIIPIAYYLLKSGAKDSYVDSSQNVKDKANIKSWLILSLLKRAFSGVPDNVLRPIRSIIQKSENGYPIREVVDRFKGTNKSLIFSDEDIDTLLSYKYGQSYTFSVLSILYPTLDFKNLFHVDHIFPKSHFTISALRKRGIPEDQFESYTDRVNLLANLQLLEATPNIEKLDKDFSEWFEDTCPSDEAKRLYKERHCIPDVPLSFDQFINFFTKREEKLRSEFQSILKVEKTPA